MDDIYVNINANAVAVAAVAAPNPFSVLTALEVCGFTIEAERVAIRDQAIPTFEAFRRMDESDITSIATEYGKRTAAAGKIVFGYNRTKSLTGFMHWVQDQWRKGLNPDENGPFDEADIVMALVNAATRKNMADNQETASKAADPGKLTINTDFYTWISGFTNYLGTIPGMTGIPLAYVIRKSTLPVIEEGADYLTNITNRAPLEGPTYLADRRQVHMLITGKVLGEPAAEWIRSLEKQKDGRTDIQALTLHFTGEGNVSRRITVAEQMYKTLHYKSERALPFSKFLIQAQTMWQIYLEEAEEKSEQAKLRWLFEKVQATHLNGANESNEVSVNQMWSNIHRSHKSFHDSCNGIV
jgi:hypothetical protein